MTDPLAPVVTAHHEAGHAVASILAEHASLPPRDIERVTIERDGDELGRSTPKALGQDFWPSVGNSMSRAVAEAAIVVCFAGPVAEARQQGYKLSLWWLRYHSVSPDGDWASAERLVRHLTHGKAEMNAYLGYLWQRTLSLTRFPDFWPCVDAVASELVEEITLDGDRVSEIVRAVQQQPGGHDALAKHVLKVVSFQTGQPISRR